MPLKQYEDEHKQWVARPNHGVWSKDLTQNLKGASGPSVNPLFTDAIRDGLSGRAVVKKPFIMKGNGEKRLILTENRTEGRNCQGLGSLTQHLEVILHL